MLRRVAVVAVAVAAVRWWTEESGEPLAAAVVTNKRNGKLVIRRGENPVTARDDENGDEDVAEATVAQ